MKPNQIEKEILKNFKIKLEDVLDAGFPKIEEEGAEKIANKRNPALMIYATAVIELKKALSTYRTQVEKENDINIKNAYLKGIADGRKEIGECCMGGCGNVNCKHCK